MSSFFGEVFLGMTLQIALSFLLTTSGRAGRCNLCVFKEKTKRIFAVIPHAKQFNNASFFLLNCYNILHGGELVVRNKLLLIYLDLGFHIWRFVSVTYKFY